MSYPFRAPLTDVFYIDPTVLNESADCWTKKLPDGRYKVRCVGQHCYIREGVGLQRNRNGRRYPAEKTWGRHTVDEAAFAQRVKARRVIGQVEHPTDGRSSMGAAAIVITKVEPPRSSDGKVFIEFETMHTPGGKIIEGFIASNVGFGISSRGNGTCIKAHDGVDEVQEDFEPVTFDCVADESTPGAEVAARLIRESLDALVAEAGSLDEAVRRDRQTAAKALEEMAKCLTEGGDVGTCCGSSADPMLEKAKTSKDAQAYISKAMSEIKDKHPDWPQDQRVAVALSKARKAGYKVGKNPNESVHADHGTRFETPQGTFVAYDNGLGQLDLWLGEHLIEASIPDAITARGVADAVARGMGGNEEGPPAGGTWLLGTDSRVGHYRMFDMGPANYAVWFYGHNTQPVLVSDGLRTAADAKSAAENHLHTVIGEAKMRENAQVNATLPFEGTCVCLRFDTPEEHKKAKGALEKAGFRCAAKDDRGIEVTTEYADAPAAVSHIRRVLTGAGIEVDDAYEESMREGGPFSIPTYDEEMEGGMDYEEEEMEGEACAEEDDYLSYYEAFGVNGRPMVGDPETMPDDLEAKHDISPEYMGDDPEDLDLDLDVNEATLDELLAAYLPEAEKKKKWIAGAIKHKGALSKTLGVPEEKNIPAGKLKAAAQKGGKTGKRARLAMTLKKMSKKKSKKESFAAEVQEMGALLRDLDEDYETGPTKRQGKPTVAGNAGSSGADTSDDMAPSKRQGKEPDFIDRGGSVDMEKKGGGGEIRPDQRKPKEGGSDLPKRGKGGRGGKSEPQSPAKMAEQIITRALPDMLEAWKTGDGRRAARISRFIEGVTRAAIREMSATGRVGRVRHLQDEVARLESENIRLRALTEAMAEVQREEILEYERKILLKDHPELGPMEHRLKRCDTVQEMQEEAKALLSYAEAQRPPQAPAVEESSNAPAAEAPPAETAPRFRLEEGAPVGGTAVGSAGIEGAPTTPLSEATVAPGMGLVTGRSGSDTASRLAAHRRRRRRG